MNLGRIGQGQRSAEAPIELLNCGDTEIDLSEVRLVSEDESFEWGWAEETPLPFTLPPRSTRQLWVSYQNNGLQEAREMPGETRRRPGAPLHRLLFI